MDNWIVSFVLHFEGELVNETLQPTGIPNNYIIRNFYPKHRLYKSNIPGDKHRLLIINLECPSSYEDYIFEMLETLRERYNWNFFEVSYRRIIQQYIYTMMQARKDSLLARLLLMRK